MWDFLENFFENKARIKIDKFKQLPSLHSAVKEGNISDIRIYLYKKYDINKQDVYGKTALHYAYETNNKDIITLLLQYSNIKEDVKDNNGYTPADLFLESLSETNTNKIDKLGEVLYYNGDE